MTLQHRAYQNKTLSGCRDKFREGAKAVLVVSPTGSGKTTMASMMAAGSVSRGGRVVWLAHRTELVDQAAKTLQAFGLEVGYRGLGASAPVQVAMAQTLLRRDESPEGTMVVADEAHHYATGNDWTRLLVGYLAAGARLVGLTATPARADGKALHGFDALVVSTNIRELTAAGHLVPLRWKGPDHPMGKDKISLTPCQAWTKHAKGRTAVVFAPHVKAATEFCDEFRLAGVRCDVVSDKTPADVRAATLLALEEGRLDCVCNVAVLTEGWDCPRVSCVIVARRVGSQALWIQMTGRGLRPFPGKRNCLLLDLCGMAHLLRLPDEDREYSLEGDGIRVTRSAAGLVRVCRVCGMPLPEGTVKCADCGKDHSLVTPVAIGSELVDWRAAYVRVRDSLNPSRPALSLAGIMRKAAARGWSQGAVDVRFKMIFKRYPDEATKRMAMQLNAQSDEEVARWRGTA